MDELEKTAQETAEETGGMAPDAGEQQVPDGEQGVPGGEEDFETLIRGRYKGEFDARVRRILDGRLRGMRQENQHLKEQQEKKEIRSLKALIYFTDGDGIYPGSKPDYETAFVFVKKTENMRLVPDWAYKLVIGERTKI